jgi:signal transduction histidine kinase/CheY-like chemotaxis protein
MRFSGWRSGSSALRSQLLAPVTLGSLPLAIFAVVAVFLLWQQQQNQFEQQQKATARAIAEAVHREIGSTVRQLEHLAASPLLARESLPAFADEARRALAVTRQWRNLVVFSDDGAQLLNLSFPLPQQPSPDGQRHVTAALRSAKPVVSDLFIGPSSQRSLVAVTIPIVRDGRSAYALSASLDFAPFDALLRERATDGTVLAIWDSSQRFISRSLAPEDFRGKQPPAAFLQNVRSAPEGWGRYTTLEGTEVFSTWTPVADTGWSIGFAVPSRQADALLRRYLWALAIAETLILITGGLLALAVSRRAARAITMAADHATQVAAGRSVDFPRTGILEIDRLGHALEAAAEKLASEAKERTSAEKQRDELFALERQARSAAEAANKSKDEFLAMLGHELRNPLAAVSNAVQLLERQGSKPGEIAFAHGVISRQTRHLTRLIDDLLDVGRVITGKIYLQKEAMNLASAVRNAINTLRTAGHAGAHRLTLGATPVFIDADRTRIEQIVINLVSNALAYTPTGGHVHVTAQREGNDAVLTVSDDGIGLTSDDRARVFDLFFQATGELHRKGGLGIGLTLVRRLVELHGGRVCVTSEGPGKGAAFTVRLPAIAAPRAEVSAVASQNPAARARSILLIEDNQDARESLRMVLALEGHTVYEAADGRSGVESAEALRPEVALVDIGLPEMDGYEVARTLRDRLDGSIVLIALTGYGQPEDERRAREAGFDAHLVKPADIDRLRALIRYGGTQAGS